jgi:hypothetical protein
VTIIGDCQTASCPSTHPHPVGCRVTGFGGGSGESRGCVASTPENPAVYFQAGDSCENGFILGTLRCSNVPGEPLSQASCPILKPMPMHVRSADMCPEIRD